jgi:signal transduction histidine kinase
LNTVPLEVESMSSVADRIRRDPARIGMTALWVGFVLVYIGFFYSFLGAEEIADAELDGYLEVILLGVPLVVLFGGLVWMSESDVDRDLHYRILAWTLGVSLLFLIAVSATLFVLEPRYDRGEHLLMLLMATGFGASMGTVTGIVEVRSVHRGRARERATVRARRRKRERQRLEYLNQYLRHEVLNEVNKIQGYADLLEARLDDGSEAETWARVIERSSDEVGTFVSSIRAIMNADDENLRIRPVDVTAVAEATADRVRTTRSGSVDRSRVIVDAPGPTYATAGDLLDRVFVNLIENALDHGDDPTVRIAVRTDDRSVTVRVSDDGPGIPESERDDVFEPPESGDHGYGLFLNRHLLELYGGRLELTETGPGGTTFTMELRAVTADDRVDADVPESSDRPRGVAPAAIRSNG